MGDNNYKGVPQCSVSTLSNYADSIILFTFRDNLIKIKNNLHNS